MNILVLGGFGFLGQHVRRVLSADSRNDVRTLSRRNGLNLHDLSSVRQWLRSMQPDVIFNCAAHVGGVHYVSTVQADVLRDNVLMASNLYQAVAECCPSTHVVNPLSNCSYPGDMDLFVESQWLSGDVHASVYPYGHAKRLVYVLSSCYGQQYGVRSTNFLIPNSFGPGDRTDPHMVHALNGMIIRMLRAWQNNDPIFEVWGSGKPIREWVYVEDAAAILASAISLPQGSDELINIAQSYGHAIRDSAAMIARAISYKGVITFNRQYQDGDPHKVMDDERFRRLFPDFRFTPLYEAIQRTVSYYKEALFNEYADAREDMAVVGY